MGLTGGEAFLMTIKEKGFHTKIGTVRTPKKGQKMSANDKNKNSDQVKRESDR